MSNQTAAIRNRDVLAWAWRVLNANLASGAAQDGEGVEEAYRRSTAHGVQAAKAWEAEADRLIAELRRRAEKPLPWEDTRG